MTDLRLTTLRRRAQAEPTQANVEALIREGQRSGQWLGCEFGEHDVDTTKPGVGWVEEDRRTFEITASGRSVQCVLCQEYVDVHQAKRSVADAMAALGRRMAADREQMIIDSLLGRAS